MRLLSGPRKVTQMHAFSLIELMVVVAIVGTLSMVAVPSYKTQVLRSEIASLMPVADALKISIMEQHTYGVVFGATEDVQIAVAASDKPKYLGELVRTFYGCISVNYDLNQLGLESGSGEELSLVLCPTSDATTGIVSWSCGYSATTTVGYATYLPAACRQAVVEDTTF